MKICLQLIVDYNPCDVNNFNNLFGQVSCPRYEEGNVSSSPRAGNLTESIIEVFTARVLYFILMHTHEEKVVPSPSVAVVYFNEHTKENH